MKLINSFVAMFDFLGFKNLRNERGTKGIYQLYMSSLLPLIQHAAALKGKTIQRDGQSVYVPDIGSQSLSYKIVSDSIILFTQGNTINDFIKIINASHSLLCGGLIGHKAPLRGSIGYGDLIYDPNSVWIGSAIEDAYIGESCQVWSGCSLTKSCEEFIRAQEYIKQYIEFIEVDGDEESDPHKKEKIERAKRRIVGYQIPEQCNPKTGPVKYSERRGYALDWTLNLYKGAGEIGFAPGSSDHSRKIIKNTRKFEVWARSHNR